MSALTDASSNPVLAGLSPKHMFRPTTMRAAALWDDAMALADRLVATGDPDEVVDLVERIAGDAHTASIVLARYHHDLRAMRAAS